MKPVYINGIGIAAPGLFGLAEATAVLKGEKLWQANEMPRLVAEILPANERRRTTSVIKLALQVALEACEPLQNQLAVATVFASSDGDFVIVDRICQALCEADKPVSPTQFHNSVHNAPAGYWAIAAQSRFPSTSVSAADATLSAGLLEAVTQVISGGQSILYVAYDFPAPPPLDEKRHFTMPFGLAFLISPSPSDTCYASIKLGSPGETQAPSQCLQSVLEAQRLGNPIALSLPLLEAIMRGQTTQVHLPYFEEQVLPVEITV